MSILRKARLALRIWVVGGRFYLALKRRPLPQVVAAVPRDDVPELGYPPRDLGRVVWRALSIGPYRARCLYTSMVLYRLLEGQGIDAELVIGLPREPRDKDAHAWVEVDGVDVGPPPGGSRHEELARYGPKRG